MEVLGLMPQEVRSAGITLPAIFSPLYGDQVAFLVRMRGYMLHAKSGYLYNYSPSDFIL